MHRVLAARVVPSVCVLVALIAGAVYAEAVPPWEAPDEPWHLVMAERLAEGRAITPADTYEWHQPPLGYALPALALGIARLGEVPRAPDNPWYPYAPAALWHVPGDPADAWMPFLRTFSGLAAGLAVALAWATVRALGPALRDDTAATAALAAVLASLWPQFLFVGHAVNNDLAAAICGSLLTYGLVLSVGRPRRRGRALRILAAAGFLAPWIKLNALVVLAAAPLATFAMRRGSARRRAFLGGSIAPSAAVALGLGAGLVAMAVRSPSVLAGLVEQGVWRGATIGAVPAGAAGMALQLLALAESWWARFGWMNVSLPGWALWASLSALAVAALGFAARLAGSRGADQSLLAVVAVPWVLVVGATLKSFLADPQPQGRLLFPAFASMVAVLACGAAATLPKAWRGAAPVTAATALVLLNALSVGRVIPTAYRGARGPLPDVALRIVPPEPAVVARLDAGRPALRQGLDLPGAQTGRRFALAVRSARGPATIELALRAGKQVLATRSWPVPAREPLSNAWLSVDWDPGALDFEPGGGLVLEAVLESAAPSSEAQFWGSFGDVYPGGELTMGRASTVAARTADRAYDWQRRPGADLTVLVLRP